MTNVTIGHIWFTIPWYHNWAVQHWSRDGVVNAFNWTYLVYALMLYAPDPWSSGKPALQIGPTSHKFAGHIWLEIHLISDRHSLYRPNMGDWLMLTIKIIHILWHLVGSSANSGGIRLESHDGRYLSLVHTYAATQTVQILGIMTTETYS